MTIEKNVFDKLNQFSPINNFGNNKNNKGFRTSKKGKDTGLFKKVGGKRDDNINLNNINIPNEFYENQMDSININNLQNAKAGALNNIQIIPKKIKKDEEIFEE